MLEDDPEYVFTFFLLAPLSYSSQLGKASTLFCQFINNIHYLKVTKIKT